MSGWPALWPLRWSEDQRHGYYKSGIWAENDLWRCLLEVASSRPEALAYSDSTQKLRFAELRDRSAALARGFANRGIGSGDIIAAQLPNWIEYPIIRHATSAIGAALLSLPYKDGATSIADLLRRTGAKVLVSAREPANEVKAALSHPGLLVSVRARFSDTIALEAISIDGDEVPRGGDSDSVDLLMGTSGTTGTPKVVMRTPNSFFAMSRSLVERIQLTGEDTLMVSAPVCQGIGYMHGIVEAALTGCHVILLEKLSAQAMLETIERERVTVEAAVPTLAIRMLELPQLKAADTSSLKWHLNGGAKLPEETARELEKRLDCRILNLYGSLDVGVATMTSPLTDTPEARHRTVGLPVEDTEVRIISPDGSDANLGEEGEIVIRGANTAIGYFSDREGTGTTFDEDGWGHLGDLGKIDNDGYLRIVGRLKDVIIRGGHNISAPEVESIARKHPAVVDAAAVGFADNELGERCALFVVPRDDAPLSLDDLVSFFANRGAVKLLWPERLELISELPMDPQGKIRKTALRALLDHPEGDLK